MHVTLIHILPQSTRDYCYTKHELADHFWSRNVQQIRITSERSLSFSCECRLNSASMAAIPPKDRTLSSIDSISLVSSSTSAFVLRKFKLSSMFRFKWSWFLSNSLLLFKSSDISFFLFSHFCKWVSDKDSLSWSSFSLSSFLKSRYLLGSFMLWFSKYYW